MPAPQKIRELVQKFESNLAQYKSASYNETMTRNEFINPFWEALGWDVNNKAGYALNYREVIHEDSIRLKGVGNSNSKAPDYAFRIGENRKFFLEAKKPSVAIKTDISPAYQLRCYGWSCGLPISVLSDFEEMAVYDCRIRPKISDPASVARIKYFTFREYIDRWDEIEDIFHRENIMRGSFDRFVQSRKSKAGTSEVDDEFLREIEEWRVILARDAAKNNPELDARALNFVVQRTIDRIVFLRMAEDRGIEPEEQLFRLIDGQKTNIYAHLLDIYRAADEKYNSGFFHFTNEPDQTEEPDTLTPKLHFSDRALTEILSRIYPPISPYRFDVLPVEILGNVYERFLGKVVRITPARLVKVEEKPEVKKANGVFYTPPYIVNYIVQNTVGRLCEGKTPKEVARLKILDPACGSGSFLLGAYKFLMDWHLKYWLGEMTRTGKIPQIPPAAGRQRKKTDPNTLCQSASGEWRLTLTERKRILLNNIYGVDLDAQAVEVTKLSLSLCVLEGFNDEALQSNLRLFYDRALPNLSENIRCGNSLIGPDFYDQSQGTLFDLEEQLTINAFDWRDPVHGFGTILKNGGFDAVIGNPPYVRVQNMEYNVIDYLKSHYKTALKRIELSLCFIEKSHELLKNEIGIASFITSNQFLTTEYGQAMRAFLLKDYALTECVDYGDLPIFKGAQTYVSIFIFQNKTPSTFDYFYVENLQNAQEGNHGPAILINCQDLDDSNWILKNANLKSVFNRIKDASEELGVIGNTWAGLFTGKDDVLMFTKDTCPDIEPEILLPVIRAQNCNRYYCSGPEKFVIYPYKYENGKTVLYTEAELKSQYPKAYNYLRSKKAILESRKDSRENFKGKKDWFGLTRFGQKNIFEQIKIVSPGETKNHKFCIDDSKAGFSCARVFAITLNDVQYDLYYILAILNSSLMKTYLQSFASLKSGGYYSYSSNILNRTPIKTIDFTNPTEKAQHNHIVRAVTELLALNRRLQTETFFNPQERVVLERRAASLDRQIDDLVFDLYGLTPEERALCE